MSREFFEDRVTGETEEPEWSPLAEYYDPLKAGSIDGTDTDPHDRAITRAIKAKYRPSKNSAGRPECTLFVGRLNRNTTEDKLFDIFSEYGDIRRCHLVRDLITGFSKCCAFIEYAKENSAVEAYKRTSSLSVDGKAIFVDFECERLLPGWKPRRLGGGFGGKKESGQLRFGGRDRPFRKPIVIRKIQPEK